MTDETKANEGEVLSTENGGEVSSDVKKATTAEKFSKKSEKTKKRKRSKKGIVVLIIILLLIFAAAAGVYMLFFKEEAKIAVTDTTIYGSLDRSISGSGTTTPAETLSVTAVSNAEIKEVFVSAGDIVSEGDILYTQDDSELDEQIADIEAQIEEYEDEINDYNTSISDTYTSISEAYDKIEGYKDEIAELRETMGDMTVKAEFSGKISEITVKEGRNVSNGASLAVLTDDSLLEVSQYYSYAYEDMVYLGMPAEVTVSGMLGTLEGRVSEISYISWSSDEGMLCFEITVDVDNPGALTDENTASCVLIARDGTKLYPVNGGSFSYKNSETVTAPASGELMSVNVKNYDSVYAGQILFEIDTEEVAAQIENLQKQITSANKQITNYSSQIANYQKKIDSTNEKISDLYEDIEELEESRADYAMKSEMSGKVMYVNIDPGDNPNTMMPVIIIYNLETMNISVNFDELDVDYVSEGTNVTITRTSAERNTYYEGVITYLSPEATSSSGVSTFAATIEIDSKGELSSGVSVTYTISLGDSEEGVLAPVAALKSHEDKYYLYVKADTRPDNAVELEDPATDIPDGFYAVPVEVGSSNAQYVRILSGVSEDTEVFTRYRQSAPGNSAASNVGNEDEEMNFENMFGQGEMPNFGGENMPNFGGGGMQSGGGRDQQSGGQMPGGR